MSGGSFSATLSFCGRYSLHLLRLAGKEKDEEGITAFFSIQTHSLAHSTHTLPADAAPGAPQVSTNSDSGWLFISSLFFSSFSGSGGL